MKKQKEKEVFDSSVNAFHLIEGLSFFELIQLKDAILFRLHKMDVSGKCSFCGKNKKPNESWVYHWSRQCIKKSD